MNETLLEYRSELLQNAVYLENRANNQNAGDKLYVDEDEYTSGEIAVLEDDTYSFKTNKERFVNFQGTGINYKHNNWNEIASKFYLTQSDEVNSDGYEIGTFKDIRDPKIDVILEGLQISGNGTPYFYDPWYVLADGSQPGNYWKSFNSSYEPTGKEGADEKGVFLNQDPAQTPTYYKLWAGDRQFDLGGSIGTRNFYFQNWSATGANFANYGNEIWPVFTSSNAVVQANFKGQGLSNDQNAYSSSSQRKFVKTLGDNYLHHVYSSLGHIWYERSTDGGSTWQIANGGSYLDNGEAKLPSIDESGHYNISFPDRSVLIVYQEKNGNNYKIKLKRFYDGFQTSEAEVYSASESFSINANPVVAFSNNTTSNDKFIIVFQSSQGLYYRFGYIENGAITWPLTEPPQEGIISSTDQYSTNSTIAARKNVGGQGDFYLAWQQYDTQIYYKKIHYEGDEITDDPTPVLYSYNDGFTYNWFPSISLAEGNYPVVSWVGHNGGASEKIALKEQGGEPIEVTKIVVKRGTTGNFFISGNNVNNVNNNSTTTTGENTVIVWSESNPAVSKWVKRTGTTYNTVANLSNSGIHTQVSNGIDLTNINAMVYNTAVTSYFFTKATTDFCGTCGISKITEDDNSLTFGRTGIAGKNDVQFVFNVGDIILADTNVQFIERPDTLIYTNTEELNEVTRSLNFNLNSQSQLFFTNYYYVVNPELADSTLSDNDTVSFRVELVNSNTNTVVGTFDEITYTKSNLEEYDNINYQVDCSGIQTGNYYLRLVTTVFGDAIYNLANVQNDEPGLDKRHYNQVNFKGNETPTVYELLQNFPNPFNPATTIKYQIPEDGMVTLKIYDILGKEVKSLVNEPMVKGRYEVKFNASDLASGVYIYRIQVNDPSSSSGQVFVSTKKMMLLK